VRLLEGVRVLPKGLILLAVMVVSLVLSLLTLNTLLLMSCILLAAYVVAVFFYAVKCTSPRVFHASVPSVVDVIAGRVKEFYVTISCRYGVFVEFIPVEPVVSVKPRQVFLGGSKGVDLLVRVRPLLSGPGYAGLRVVVRDVRGLVERGFEVVRVRLNVIPRARVARQLILRAVSRAGLGVELRPESGSLRPHRVGLEYIGSRLFLPGDSPRFIDWKKSVKIHKLYVKEFSAAFAPPVVVALNLRVTGVEEADRLAFLFLVLVYTLVRGGVSVGVLAYSGCEVKLFFPPKGGVEALKQALKAIEFIEVCEGAGRISDPKPLRLREYYLVSPELGLFKKKAILSRISDHPFSALIRRYRNIRLVHVCDGRVLNQVETYLHERLRRIGIDVTLLTTKTIM